MAAAKQDCLDKNLLQIISGVPSVPQPGDLTTRFYPRNGSRIYEIKALLPEGKKMKSNEIQLYFGTVTWIQLQSCTMKRSALNTPEYMLFWQSYESNSCNIFFSLSRLYRLGVRQLCDSMAIHCRQQLGNMPRWLRCRWLWPPRRIPSMRWYRHRYQRTWSPCSSRHQDHTKSENHRCHSDHHRIRHRNIRRANLRSPTLHQFTYHRYGCIAHRTLSTRCYLSILLPRPACQTVHALESTPTSKDTNANGCHELAAKCSASGATTYQKTVANNSNYQSVWFERYERILTIGWNDDDKKKNCLPIDERIVIYLLYDLMCIT